MARITPSALVTDIKGSVGGVAFASWKGITIVRSKARSVRNPMTTAQRVIREAVTFFSKRYADDLSDDQRAGWDQFAQEMASAERADQVQGGFGKRVVPKRQFQKSGYNWFVGINVRLVRMIGVGHYNSPIDDAPLGQTPPSQPVITSVVYNPVTGRFGVRANSPEDFGHVTQLTMGWWVRPNWGKARIQHTSNEEVPGGQERNFNMAQILIPRGAIGLPSPDGVYAFQVDAVGRQNGLASPPSNIVIMQGKFGGPGAFFSSDSLEMEAWRELRQVPLSMT